MNNETKDSGHTVDWKSILEAGLSNSSEIVSSERAWAKFCTYFRDLCPETEWINIAKITKQLDIRTLDESRKILSTLISHSSWPFPKRVILAMNTEKDFSLKIYIDSKHEIKTTVKSKTISIRKIEEKYSTGWELAPKEQIEKSVQREI